ncbi:MAG TPA: enoyl-CoA hydratase-related protein [Candidatus Eisenbacteria bacterium]|nr:enoyl-CoA hydratase-related protein [Candidatus Eisenbacteria bacterium]
MGEAKAAGTAGALVEVEHDGPVARVWFNRPAVHNALSAALGEALLAALRALAHDAGCRVVVLGGRGPSFCAGADIGAMRASAGAPFEANLAEAEGLARVFAAVAEFPRPVVGRVHGGVYGGGVGFCCACDVAVAADDARFGLTEVRLGILPALISPYVLRRLGDRHARELMLTGERFGAAEALRRGIVDHVAPAAELDAAVAARVDALLPGGPQAQHRIKTLLARWADTPWEEYRSTLPRTLAEARGGDEAREGLGAFLDKRKPGWTG